ncbi:MAG: large rane associated protein [Rhodoglobus sp.]|nr:large rane associated protein [Rhodoglobus sp.]
MTDRDDDAPFQAPFQWGLTPSGNPEPEPPIPPVEVPPEHPTPLSSLPAQPSANLPPTAPFSFDELENVAPHAAPLDSAIDGVTEAIHAHPIGLPDPVDEGLEPSAIDALFGDTQFRDYVDEPLIAPPAPRQSSELVRVETPRPPRTSRTPIPRTQKILMWVAGGLVAALALVALFALGTRLSSVFGPAPAVVVEASPTPSASAAPLGIGPVAPGDYQWDQLLGGECLQPFESAWQDRYTVIGCTEPHAAQLVYRGLFADALDTEYPGVEALQLRVSLPCAAPTAIDYAAAAGTNDIQVTTSFAADAADWAAGNRSFFCFVARSSGEPLTVSIAVPQTGPAVPVPAPTPAAP